jgi:5-methylcytosine-specific restriction endonuclease McrA
MGTKTRITAAYVEKMISENGGYSKATLQKLGVPWPPKKGWKKRLISQCHAAAHAKPGTEPAKPKRAKTNRKTFYSSWEWKRARYEALRLHGHRCQCCGWRPGDTEGGRLVVDHIKPRSKFPSLELDVGNLQVLCNDCNQGKSNVYTDDYRNVEDWFSSFMRDHT